MDVRHFEYNIIQATQRIRICLRLILVCDCVLCRDFQGFYESLSAVC